MTLLAAAACVLAIGGAMAWLVRAVLADITLERAQLLAALERTLDRVEAPGATPARLWETPEAPAGTLTQADEEWLSSKESEVPWLDDLALADTETQEG